MVKEKGMQFFIINMKMKRKRDKKIDLSRQGFEPRIFEQIPAQKEMIIFWIYGTSRAEVDFQSKFTYF